MLKPSRLSWSSGDQATYDQWLRAVIILYTCVGLVAVAAVVLWLWGNPAPDKAHARVDARVDELHRSPYPELPRQ
jgi:hypothetical protein